MLDYQNSLFDFDDIVTTPAQTRSRSHWPKSAFDLFLSIMLLVPLTVTTLVLLVFNPFFNRGSLLFLQERMGRDCQPFTAIKFRTMRPEDNTQRGAFDTLEVDRISRFGLFLRRTRLDELPQIINVLRGEMSLIGPRPDSYAHAQVYLKTVPDYADRHQVLPGISGLAQTEIGYVDGLDGIHHKVRADLDYIANADLRVDLWITWRTLCVVVGRKGR